MKCPFKKPCLDCLILNALEEPTNIRTVWRKLKNNGTKITEPTINYRLRKLEDLNYIKSSERKIPRTNIIERIYKVINIQAIKEKDKELLKGLAKL